MVVLGVFYLIRITFDMNGQSGGIGPRIGLFVDENDPSWGPLDPGSLLPNHDVGPLWLWDCRGGGRVWLGVRLSDLVRAVAEVTCIAYPPRLPGSQRSSDAQLAARRELARRLQPQRGPKLDPASDGSLLRSLAARHIVTFGRL